jgi:hypothetical protein
MKSLKNRQGSNVYLRGTSGYDLATLPTSVTNVDLSGTSGYDLATLPTSVTNVVKW